MIDGWTRTCPSCSVCNGDLVERIGFMPTFRCACGYFWSRYEAKLVVLTRPPDPDDGKGIGILVDRLLKALTGSQAD
jgi:hypothetical protein